MAVKTKETEEKRSLRESIRVREAKIKIMEGHISDLDAEIEVAGPGGRAQGEAIRAQLTWNLEQNRKYLEIEKKRFGGRGRGVEEDSGEEEVEPDGN